MRPDWAYDIAEFVVFIFALVSFLYLRKQKGKKRRQRAKAKRNVAIAAFILTILIIINIHDVEVSWYRFQIYNQVNGSWLSPDGSQRIHFFGQVWAKDGPVYVAIVDLKSNKTLMSAYLSQLVNNTIELTAGAKAPQGMPPTILIAEFSTDSLSIKINTKETYSRDMTLNSAGGFQEYASKVGVEEYLAVVIGTIWRDNYFNLDLGRDPNMKFSIPPGYKQYSILIDNLPIPTDQIGQLLPGTVTKPAFPRIKNLLTPVNADIDKIWFREIITADNGSAIWEVYYTMDSDSPKVIADTATNNAVIHTTRKK